MDEEKERQQEIREKLESEGLDLDEFNEDEQDKTQLPTKFKRVNLWDTK